MSAKEVNILDESKARRLWNEHRGRVANAEPGETIDFSGTEFFEDPDDKYFHGIKFTEVVDFTGAMFELGHFFDENTVFNKEAIFTDAIFKEDIGIDAIFEGKATFDGAIFSRVVSFHSKFKNDASFENTVFSDDALFGTHSPGLVFDSAVSFEGAEFKSSVDFRNLTFNGNVSFKRTIFYYWSEFIDLKFNGEVDFEVSCFKKHTGTKDIRRNLVRFNKVTFNEKVSFLACSFDCKTSFQKILFKGESNFRLVGFKERAEFIEVRTEGRMFFGRDYTFTFPNYPQDAIMPYRLAKLSATSAGDLRWAGYYHYVEQSAINSTARLIAQWNPFSRDFWRRQNNGFLLWGEFLIGRGIFGYGEKPIRPLIAGAIVIFICGSAFWVTKGIDHNPPCSFWSSMYFSIVTFTTLGYGDLKPVSYMRWLSATEAILGATLMALFVVALSRKFIRQ